MLLVSVIRARRRPPLTPAQAPTHRTDNTAQDRTFTTTPTQRGRWHENLHHIQS